MTRDSNRTAPGKQKPPRFGIGSLLLTAVLGLIFFLLFQSMERHRFFSGGRINRNGTLRP